MNEVRKAEPVPIERTPGNIARVVKQLENEGFLRGNEEQERVFNLIVEGRLKGYTSDNCSYPGSVKDGQYILCTQCGYQEMT